nr:hypothetical protein [Cressdnaviricota sp.]
MGCVVNSYAKRLFPTPLSKNSPLETRQTRQTNKSHAPSITAWRLPRDPHQIPPARKEVIGGA